MPTSQPSRVAFVVIALACLALLPARAAAQGTEEQTEACSGDAFTLCRGDIPNVAKITACMRVHRSELSPRCRAVFDASDAPKAAPPKVETTKRAEPHASATKPVAPKEAKAKGAMTKGMTKTKEAKATKAPKVAGRKLVGPQTAETPVVPRRRPKPMPALAPRETAPVVAVAPPPAPAPSSTPGLDSYRASIAKSCEQGLIDAYTCRSTMKMLDGM